VLPLRIESTMTTADLRKQDFEFVVAPGSDGRASGNLYIDDGVSIAPPSSTTVNMSYAAQTLAVQGSFQYDAGVDVNRVRFLNVLKQPKSAVVNGKEAKLSYSALTKVLEVEVGLPLTRGFKVGYE